MTRTVGTKIMSSSCWNDLQQFNEMKQYKCKAYHVLFVCKHQDDTVGHERVIDNSLRIKYKQIGWGLRNTAI